MTVHGLLNRQGWLRLCPVLARRVGAMVLAGIILAALFWIASAYLHSDLRKAIIFSGFGLC